MRTIFIDSENHRITEVSPGGWRDFKGLIGPACDGYEVAGYLPSGDCLLVDEEGLHEASSGRGFQVPWVPFPLAGNGLIVGTDANRMATDCRTEADMKLADAVDFIEVEKRLGKRELDR